MKKITFLSAAIGFTAIANGQTISSYPYLEDFEAQVTCPTGCGAACQTITGGWTNVITDDLDWLVDVNGTSSSNTGPTSNSGADHTIGAGGKYIYVETSCNGTGYSNKTAILESPWYNFSAITGAMQLDFWYHAYGQTQGPLVVEARQGTVGLNSAWIQIGNTIQDDIDLWQNSKICFPTNFIGLDSVQFRFNYTSGTSFTGDVALDDISLIEIIPDDAALTQISEISGCGLTSAETITFDLQNQGGIDISPGTSFQVSYSINGATPVTETFTNTNLLHNKCAGAGIETFSFNTLADLSSTGTYNVEVWVDYTGDLNNSNDTLSISIINTPIFGGIPYFENFENGPNGWTIDTVNTSNSSWFYGTPALSTIMGAASGDSAFVTGFGNSSYNADENSWVESPCFDISNANGNEWVSIKIWYESEFSWDGANLTVSYDGGSTWSLIGNIGTTEGYNWYNDAGINGAPGGSTIGWSGRNSSGNGSGNWICATHKLDSADFVGNGSAKFRINFGSDGGVQDNGFAFDDFAIGYPITYNGLADSVTGICDTVYTVDAGAGYDFYVWENIATGEKTLGQTLDVLSTGNYSVTVSDATGMCASDTVYVELFNFVNPDLTSIAICLGDTITLDAPLDVNYTYAWSTGDSVNSIQVSNPGLISLTQTDIVSGCSATDSALVSIFEVNLNDTIVCEDVNVVLDATLSNGTYAWSTGATTPSISISNLDGTFSVTVTDSISGCVTTDMATLTFNPNLSVDLGLDPTICVNHTLDLDAGMANSYLWSTGETTQIITVDGPTLGAGTYNFDVTITDVNGCTDMDAIVVTVDPCTGITEANALGLSVYPNPSNGIINYNLESANVESNIRVTSIGGQLIYQETVRSNAGTIDISGISKGVYILTVESNNVISNLRLIVE